MAEPRRMRRFVAADGTEFDETPDGTLRRRLQRGDKSPIPKPPGKGLRRLWLSIEVAS